MIEQLLRTPFTELTGVRHPVVQTGMGWVSGPRLVSGTANAGGLGILIDTGYKLRDYVALVVGSVLAASACGFWKALRPDV